MYFCLDWIWKGKKINIFSKIHCFRLNRKGVPLFLVYSKECKIINAPTKVRFTFPSIITLQISTSFCWKITTITFVSPLQLGFKKLTALTVQCTVHDVIIKITSYQSSWRTYLNFLCSGNAKTFFLCLLQLSITHWNSVIFFLLNNWHQYKIAKLTMCKTKS
jgi:hypothetical protein